MSLRTELIERAMEVMEATLGGSKYKGKENPNSNHTSTELKAKEKEHTTLAKTYAIAAEKENNLSNKKHQNSKK